MFLFQSATEHSSKLSKSLSQTASLSKRMTIFALLATLAAVLQSAGGFIPIIGLMISPFATAPVIISTVLSLRYGSIGYLLAILLLFLIQPSEVLIFAFTTGLLGFGIGVAYYFFKKRLSLILTGAIFLLSGIVIVLFIFQFPLLGPSIQATSSLLFFLSLSGFCFLYSWLWIEISLVLLKRIATIFSRRR